jgi:hypothetical protein
MSQFMFREPNGFENASQWPGPRPRWLAIAPFGGRSGRGIVARRSPSAPEWLQMKWTRRFFSFGLVLALVAGVSCTAGDTSPMEPAAQPIEQPAQSLALLDGLGGLLGGVLDLTGAIVSDLLSITGLLTCQEQQYAVTYATIGPWGGTIKVGKHTLVIPKGALSSNVRIKAEQMTGSTNSVRFSPEGLQFKKQAALALSYQNCQNVDVPKAVVYTTEKLKVLEILRSLDLLKSRTITAPIDHFSRYAVAY